MVSLVWSVWNANDLQQPHHRDRTEKMKPSEPILSCTLWRYFSYWNGRSVAGKNCLLWSKLCENWTRITKSIATIFDTMYFYLVTCINVYVFICTLLIVHTLSSFSNSSIFGWRSSIMASITKSAFSTAFFESVMYWSFDRAWET